MTYLTGNQLLALVKGMKCSHCDKKAQWICSEDLPAYCDEHYPYWEFHGQDEPPETQ